MFIFFYLSETPKAGEAEGKYYIVLMLIFYSLHELLYIIFFNLEINLILYFTQRMSFGAKRRKLPGHKKCNQVRTKMSGLVCADTT